MYFETAFILVLSLVTLSSCQQDDEIIRQSYEGPEPDGSYRWALQTEGGIFHEQRGSLRQGRAEVPALFVEGQYQYTAPDGEVINVLYTAGEDGFIATGAHIPTPPPVPPLIQRSLDYIASLRGNTIQGNAE